MYLCGVTGPTHNRNACKEFYVDEKYVTILTTWCIGDLIISHIVPENLFLVESNFFLEMSVIFVLMFCVRYQRTCEIVCFSQENNKFFDERPVKIHWQGLSGTGDEG